MESLKGKVAVVTGGARDIGRAVSLKLAAEGAKVCINYCHSPEKARETQKQAETTEVLWQNLQKKKRL